jgi:uncharacterized membrane protein YhaH (DUF805 family)
MKEIFWFLFLFNGRLNRKGYWLFTAPIVLLAILGQQEVIVVNTIIMLCLVWISFAVIIKRLHDINKSGWWSLIVLIPILGGLATLALGFMKGSQGENDFGSYNFLSD